MSVLALSSTTPAVGSQLTFLAHHKGAKGTQHEAASAAQIPVSAGQGLLANLVQTLEQVLGIAPAPAPSAAPAANTGSVTAADATAAGAAISATTSAAATAPNQQVVQDLHGFVHSLFKALREDAEGPRPDGAAATTTGVASAGAAATGATAASSYQGTVVSSLQSLIQQLGGSGAPGPAATQLEQAFNRLSQDLGTNGRAAGAAAGTSAGLQQFLNGFLQDLQSTGNGPPSLVGANVNAKA